MQIRRCLKIGNVPNGEGFFRQTKPIWRRNTWCIPRKIGKVWRKKSHRLGMMTIFKQALGWKSWPFKPISPQMPWEGLERFRSKSCARIAPIKQRPQIWHIYRRPWPALCRSWAFLFLWPTPSCQANASKGHFKWKAAFTEGTNLRTLESVLKPSK